jgi:tetratricopeptide (TPR) repeat protein/transcriptional regulator with XRE-family HTH domain
MQSFRVRAKLSQQEVATALGITRVTVSNWERAKYLPKDRDLVLHIAVELSLTPAETDQLLRSADFPDEYKTPAPVQSLHQLRAPVGDFVGREREIAQLVEVVRRAIGSGAVAAISGVRGMGGIGKTELAYVVAHQLALDFPDAQIVVELRGASNQPLTPIQALQTIIRTFEREARLPDDVAELQAIYRSLLSGRHVLVLADDARDAAQIRPLLPPPGCVLLVTSRYRFTLPDMLAIDLGTLALSESEALLLTICPRIGDAAAVLAKLCGYLPLALRISAGLLASDATLLVARYLERLADERMRLAMLRDPDDPTLDVGAVLALSYAALASAPQATLYQLSVFVADFDLSAAQAVVVLDQEQSLEAVLGDLYRRSLLDYNSALERYILHDLVRVFAHTRLDAETNEALMLRYAQHYVQIARQADKLYLQGGESVLMGLALFDRERAHIDAGWTVLLGQMAGPESDELLIAYADATVYCGYLRYDVRRERLVQLAAALAAARRRGHRPAQSMALDNLGVAYTALGEPRRGIDSYEQSLVVKREVSDRRGEGQTLGNLGMAYMVLGEASRAIDYFEQDLAIAREIGDRREQGNALGNLGLAYANLGKLRLALDYYEQSLVIKREVGDRRGEGLTLNNLGLAFADLGEVQQAIAFYEQSLEIAREVGDRRGEGGVLDSLGVAYARLGEVRQAIDSYEQALAVLSEVGDRRNEVIGGWNMGLLLAQQGDLARGVALMQVRVDYERSIGHTDAEAHAAHVEKLRRQLHVAEDRASPDALAPPEGDALHKEPLPPE